MAGTCDLSWCDRPSPTTKLCPAHGLRQRQGRELSTPIRPNSANLSCLIRDAKGNKLCIDCQMWWPTSMYGNAHKAPDGLVAKCNSCRYYERLKKAYGLDIRQYLELLQRQDSKCAICKQHFEDQPCVDHDHDCCPGVKTCGNCIRGLLCRTCNSGIGLLGDNAVGVRQALIYLESYSGKTISY